MQRMRYWTYGQQSILHAFENYVNTVTSESPFKGSHVVEIMLT